MTLAPPIPWIADHAAESLVRLAAAIARRGSRPLPAPMPQSPPVRDADRDRLMLERAFRGRMSRHLLRDIGCDGL